MKNPILKNKWQIVWQIVNSGLSAGLVLAGAFSSGTISMSSVIMASGAAIIVFLTQFKKFWESEEKEYKTGIYFI